MIELTKKTDQAAIKNEVEKALNEKLNELTNQALKVNHIELLRIDNNESLQDIIDESISNSFEKYQVFYPKYFENLEEDYEIEEAYIDYLEEVTLYEYYLISDNLYLELSSNSYPYILFDFLGNYYYARTNNYQILKDDFKRIVYGNQKNKKNLIGNKMNQLNKNKDTFETDFFKDLKERIKLLAAQALRVHHIDILRLDNVENLEDIIDQAVLDSYDEYDANYSSLEDYIQKTTLYQFWIISKDLYEELVDSNHAFIVFEYLDDYYYARTNISQELTEILFKARTHY